MKVIFMGSPDFAVPTLNRLIESDHEVVAVYTKEPRPKNRGHMQHITPINKIALENNIKLYVPRNFKNQVDIDDFIKIDADIVIVSAYGLILPSVILKAKKYGCINIHPSSLPKFRGAAPIEWTILYGEIKTSVCIMQMDEGLDTGDILLQQYIDLDYGMSASDLHDKCAIIGSNLALEALDKIDHLKPIKQTGDPIYASKITKEMGRINPQNDILYINRQILALNPWPGTYIDIDDNQIKILSAEIKQIQHNYEFGSIIDKKLFSIACKNGILYPKIVQRAGKKSMPVSEFLNSYYSSKA